MRQFSIVSIKSNAIWGKHLSSTVVVFKGTKAKKRDDRWLGLRGFWYCRLTTKEKGARGRFSKSVNLGWDVELRGKNARDPYSFGKRESPVGTRVGIVRPGCAGTAQLQYFKRRGKLN